MTAITEHLVYQNIDCEIHYWYRRGTSHKWVLFFHGAGVDHDMFSEQLKAFDETYHLIAWDARGHGLSKLEEGASFHFKDMISDCLRLYDLHEIDKAILIGQSMGGNLVQEIAYYYPERIEKAVLIDCTKNTGKLTLVENILLKSTKFMLNAYPWKTLIEQSANACGNKAHVKKYVIDCFERMDKKTFIDIMIEVTKCLHYDPEFRFKNPVLLLCGSDDKTGNIRTVAEPWAKEDGNCTLHFIEHAGHNANQDEPEVVNQLIIDFVTS